MAQALPTCRNVICTFLIFSSLVQAQSHQFANTLSPKSLGFTKEKLTHFHFYFHVIVTGDHPIAVTVAEAPTTKTSSTYFGLVVTIDAPLTVDPERTSKIVGRAQGIYTSASLSEQRFVMALNYVFTEGKYNGSTLSILGSNSIFAKVREMPIVGGSGFFRLARGYALAKTYSYNLTSGNAVIEYDAYVIHY